jgi:hypothetical protein
MKRLQPKLKANDNKTRGMHKIIISEYGIDAS